MLASAEGEGVGAIQRRRNLSAEAAVGAGAFRNKRSGAPGLGRRTKEVEEAGAAEQSSAR
eukprot:2950681-Alexandrium_andersonii.AAC.1